jgi:hypothetical protein
VSVERIRLSTSFAETADAWSDFLLAASRIYSKFEQGVKGDNRAQNWFNLIKRERKKDELMRYIHFARNAEEHGLKKTSSNLGKVARVYSKDGGPTDLSIFKIAGDVKIHSVSEKIGDRPFEERTIGGWESFARLERAHDDRYNDYCDPPKSHAGNLIYAITPLDAASGALTYLQNMIIGAEHFLEDQSPK